MTKATQNPAGVADLEKLHNPNGIRVVSTYPPILVATCKLCRGLGRREAFICSACAGAGVVHVKGGAPR